MLICFCNLQFHTLIIENQIGALTMDIIELEIKRTDHRTKEEGLTPSELAQKALDSRAHITVLSDRYLSCKYTSYILCILCSATCMFKPFSLTWSSAPLCGERYAGMFKVSLLWEFVNIWFMSQGEEAIWIDSKAGSLVVHNILHAAESCRGCYNWEENEEQGQVNPSSAVRPWKYLSSAVVCKFLCSHGSIFPCAYSST